MLHYIQQLVVNCVCRSLGAVAGSVQPFLEVSYWKQLLEITATTVNLNNKVAELKTVGSFFIIADIKI